MSPPDQEPEQDPFLAELIDEVLADHEDVPAEVAAEIRWVLELAATTHPLLVGMVNRARPRKPPLQSGDQPSPGATAAAVPDDDRREGTDG